MAKKRTAAVRVYAGFTCLYAAVVEAAALRECT